MVRHIGTFASLLPPVWLVSWCVRGLLPLPGNSPVVPWFNLSGLSPPPRGASCAVQDGLDTFFIFSWRRHKPQGCDVNAGCSSCLRNERGKKEDFKEWRDQEEGTAQVILPASGVAGALLPAGSGLRAREGQQPCSGRGLSWQPGTSSRDRYLLGSYREGGPAYTGQTPEIWSGKRKDTWQRPHLNQASLSPSSPGSSWDQEQESC